MDTFKVDSLEDCESACGLNDLCFTYTYKNNLCWLKFRYRYEHTAIRDVVATSGYPVVGECFKNVEKKFI